MTKPVILDEDAAQELAAAADWYEAREPGLGRDLVAAVRAAATRIGTNPQRARLVPDVRPDLA